MNRQLDATLTAKYGKERPLDGALSYIHEQADRIAKTLELIDGLEDVLGAGGPQGVALDSTVIWDMLRLSLDPSYTRLLSGVTPVSDGVELPA